MLDLYDGGKNKNMAYDHAQVSSIISYNSSLCESQRETRAKFARRSYFRQLSMQLIERHLRERLEKEKVGKSLRPTTEEIFKLEDEPEKR